MFRNSHWKCSIKKAVLKIFAIFIGKNRVGVSNTGAFLSANDYF